MLEKLGGKLVGRRVGTTIIFMELAEPDSERMVGAVDVLDLEEVPLSVEELEDPTLLGWLGGFRPVSTEN